MTTEIQNALLELVRLGLGNASVVHLPKVIDWQELKNLADAQGVTAIVLDGLDRVQEVQGSRVQESFPFQMKLEWIGEVLQNYEQRYLQYEKAIGSLAGFYNQHGYKMMVVKGYACALDWPRPNHRPCGDIDIWLFGKQKEADKALVNSSRIGELENKVTIDSGHHHHTVFEWDGFTVENHYDFLNVHQHRSNIELEKIVKGEATLEKSGEIKVDNETVYLPSANLHALFLLRHAMTHFSATEINLRQLLDWAFFVKAHTKEIDWEWLEGILEEYGMKRLYEVFNAICVGDLGFDVSIFPKVQFNPTLKDRVLADILSPEFAEKEDGNIVRRYGLKYRRWQANQWKQDLCFNDSRWSAFWTGVWGHLVKPKSI